MITTSGALRLLGSQVTKRAMGAAVIGSKNSQRQPDDESSDTCRKRREDRHFIKRLSLRIAVAAHLTVTPVRFDRSSAVIDTMAGGIHENQAARISKSRDHRRNDSAG